MTGVVLEECQRERCRKKGEREKERERSEREILRTKRRAEKVQSKADVVALVVAPLLFSFLELGLPTLLFSSHRS
jgi:hypothetical protein